MKPHLVRDLLNLNAVAARAREEMELSMDTEALEWNTGSVIDINARDEENSTPLCLALKSKNTDCARFLLKSHLEKLQLNVRSKRYGNMVNLAVKTQNFEIIEIILSHQDIKDKDNYLLNFIIPHFEKNPKENSKVIVKLIMDKEVDPNHLRVKYLRKDQVEDATKSQLPKQILDVSPIALACQKYQNNALNFIIKYNGAIR